MKKNIYFIRGNPYSYAQPRKDLYDSFDAVATDAVDPECTSMHRIESVIPKKGQKLSVFVSDRLRSVQTGKLYDARPIILPELHEIHYTMNQFITKADFFDGEKANVDRARKAFVRALIHDQLGEPYLVLMNRIKKLFAILEEADSDCVCVTHGFLLKVIESFLHDPSIVTNPERLLKFFSGEKETFHFNEGFRYTPGKKGILPLKRVSVQ
jgi:hypothetical protein